MLKKLLLRYSLRKLYFIQLKKWRWVEEVQNSEDYKKNPKKYEEILEHVKQDVVNQLTNILKTAEELNDGRARTT